ncbi:O-antigen ligase family protein [Marinobacter bryozoorum]|uniref:O-antigen ligase family protein n=1 Tax=Marinobacter bryozoorum TaxID=256324 RepID=UPI002006560E|nr:O-antigen ligase family protein [Marinobacter bryozoorum]MCK7544028.1 O-antigen ligase family protein [Marinobacter bryozoorum]
MSKFALLFLMVFAGCVIATFFFSGAASFFLYQLVYFLNPDARWWSAQIPGVSYSFFSAILMLIALGLGYRKYSELAPWKQQPVFKWMLMLLAMYYVVGFYALSPVLHERFTFNFLKLLIIVLVAYKLLHSRATLHASIWAYLIGATYIGYLATITGRNVGDRVEGIGVVDSPDSNGVASTLVPAATLLMYYAWLGNKKAKVFCVICGALIANGLVLINSRGSFVGVVISGGVFLLIMMFSKYRQKGQRAMAIFIAVLGLGGAFYVADDTFWERMSTLQNPEDEKASGSGRINYWLASVEMTKDHPLGIGVQGFNQLAPIYLGDEFENKSVHSLWFQGLSEVGWFGFTFFIAMLVSVYRLSRKARKWVLSQGDVNAYFQIRALECGLIGFLAAGSFINQFRSEILYWMILFLVVASNVYYLRHQSDALQKSHTFSKERRAPA